MNTKSQAISGTVWTTISAAVRTLIQILRLAILTRYLEKSDFGIVAIVLLVLGFTHIFADLGVSVALYSRQNISQKEYSSLYWVGILLSLCLYIVLIVLTPTIALIYKLEDLRALIPLMGLDIIFSTAGKQFRIFREKALQFKQIALIDMTTACFSLMIAFLLAMSGYGVYSLVLSTLFASFSSSLFFILSGLKSHPLSLYINISENKSFYKIGFYQTGTQILDFFSSKLDIILMGLLMPLGDLGVYNLIKELVIKVYMTINPIVSRVAIPLLAKVQTTPEILKKQYLQLVNFIGIINFCIYSILALNANLILSLLYGKQYLSSISIFQILCIWGAFSGVGSIVSILVVIKGRTDVGFTRTIIRIIINSIFIIVGSYWGFMGIVIAQVIYSFTFYYLNWRMLVYRIINNITFKEYAKDIFPLIILMLFFVLFSILFQKKLEIFNSYILNIGITIFFLIIYTLFNKKVLLELYHTILRKQKV